MKRDVCIKIVCVLIVIMTVCTAALATSRNQRVRPTTEQSFGQIDNRGISLDFARLDHTHGTPPSPSTTIFGTAGEVNVSDNLDGTITLSLPDVVRIDGGTPSRILSLDSGRFTATIADLTDWIAGTANKVTLTDDGDGTATVSLPNSIQLDGATASRLLATDGSKRTVSTDITGYLAGTVNSVTVADDGDGTATVSLPSDLRVVKITPSGRLVVPMGEISYFDMTGTSVTISSTSDGSTNMVKATASTSLNGDAYEFDNGGADNGRLRYTGATTKHFHAACTISIDPVGANDVFVFGVAKNGTVVAASKVLVQIAGAAEIKSTAMHVMVELATNDYLELFVGNTSDTDDVTIHSVNLFAMGM